MLRINENEGCSLYSGDGVHFTPEKGAHFVRFFQIGSKNVKSENIVIPNSSQIEALRMPSSSDQLVEIIIQRKSESTTSEEKIKSIITNSINENYSRLYEELLIDLSKDKNIDDSFFLSKFEKLNGTLEKVLMEVEPLSNLILDYQSNTSFKMIDDAIREIEVNKNIERANRILNIDDLNKRSHLLLNNHDKINKELHQILKAYKLKISLLKTSFKFNEAHQCYQNGIEILRKINNNSQELTRWLEDYAISLESTGHFKRAIEVLKMAVDCQVSYLDSTHCEIAYNFIRISSFYNDTGDFDHAIQFQLKGMNIYINMNDVRCNNFVYALSYISETYFKIGDYNAALYYAKLYSEYIEDFHANDEYLFAESLSNLSAMYYMMSQYDKSLELARRSLELKKVLLKPNDVSYISSYNNIAMIHSDLKEYEKAIDYLKRAINIAIELFGSESPNLIYLYSNLGVNLQHYKLSDSYDYLQKAIILIKENWGETNYRLSTCYNNLGVSFMLDQSYETAIYYFKKSILIQDNSSLKNEKNYYKTYENIAQSLSELDSFQLALKYQKIAIDKNITNYKNDSPKVADSFHAIASIYRGMDSFALAIKYERRAIDIYEKTIPNHPNYDFLVVQLEYTLSDKALMHFRKMEYDSAITYFTEAISTVERKESWNYLGLSYYYIGDLENSIKSYLQAIKLSKPKMDNVYNNNLGLAYLKNQQQEKAKESFELFEKHFPNSPKSKRNWILYYVLEQDYKESANFLQKAVDLGFDDTNWLYNQHELKYFLEDSDVVRILKAMER